MIVYVMWLSDRKESNYCDYVVHALVKHFLSPPGEERYQCFPLIVGNYGIRYRASSLPIFLFRSQDQPLLFDFQHSLRCLFFMLLFYTF